MTDRRRVLTAYQHRSATTFFGALTLIATAGWAGQHALHAMNIGTEQGSRLAVVWIATFGMLAAQVVLYHLERPPKATPRALRQLAGQHVAIVVPVYNEDPGYLRMMLESFTQQTRTPDSVHVVDDGSTSGDYADVRDWWWHTSTAAGITASWQRTPNQGKRHAQAVAIRCAEQADIIITVDSDSYLAPTAVEEVIKPFVKAKVQSVAGIVMATNNRGPTRPDLPSPPAAVTAGRAHKRAMRTWRRRRRVAVRQWRGQKVLSRITDLWFVTGQLCDRSSQSAIGSVLVNSGPLAAYRAEVVRDNLDAYLDEWFMGRRVMFSDDSLLTLYARMRGTTVQNPRAVVFSAMPEKASHLHRMYLRWMRGSTIRSLWRIRYLPATSPAFWFQAFRWFQVALSTMIIGWLILVEPLLYRDAPPASFLFVPFLIGYAQGLRYLSVFRSDERLRSRALTLADDAAGGRMGVDRAALAALVRRRHLRENGLGHPPKRRRSLPGYPRTRPAGHGRHDCLKHARHSLRLRGMAARRVRGRSGKTRPAMGGCEQLARYLDKRTRESQEVKRRGQTGPRGRGGP